MEIKRICVYCGNEVNGEVCLDCQEYDGIVDCLVINGEVIEPSFAQCEDCGEMGMCFEIEGVNYCGDCLVELWEDLDEMVKEQRDEIFNKR